MLRKAKAIILKLDDVAQSGEAERAVSAGWQRAADYCEKNKIKAGFGIVCDSLEQENPAYFDWIKERQQRGTIEFWLHGYYTRRGTDTVGEFETGTAAQQAAILAQSEKLAREKLGFSLVAFGAHWSGVTAETEQAVEATAEIKFWLGGPKRPQFYRRLSIPLVAALECAVGKVDFEQFRADYERVGVEEKVLVLQGHANGWDEQSFAAFAKAVEFLKVRNVVFMTPSQYLRTAGEGKR